jgi:hypothetical protein
LRLQAWLTGKYRLRRALAPTTDFRRYYDQLPDDPFADDSDPATAAAKLGAARSEQPPWAPHLQAGLVATAKIMRVVRALGARDPAREKPPIWWELKP